MSKGANICHMLGKPSQAEAKKLAEMFPASCSATMPRKRSQVFDPKVACVALPQQKKKKKAVQFKPVSVPVVLMKEFTHSLPKRGPRKELHKEGRIQTLQFKCNMSIVQVQYVNASGK